jgi:hypothetical protein
MSAETDDATNKNEIRAVAEEISSRDVEDEPAAAVADADAAVEDVVVAREEEGEEDDDEEAEGMEVDDDTAKMGKRPLETEDQPTPSASAATGDDIAPVTKTANLPDRPIKKARTAYFIFADEMRPELQKKVRDGYMYIKYRLCVCVCVCVCLLPLTWHGMAFLRPAVSTHTISPSKTFGVPGSILANPLGSLLAKRANFGPNWMKLPRLCTMANLPKSATVSPRNWPSTCWMGSTLVCHQLRRLEI